MYSKTSSFLEIEQLTFILGICDHMYYQRMEIDLEGRIFTGSNLKRQSVRTNCVVSQSFHVHFDVINKLTITK